ncbi:hypothetical protein FHY55_00390 [Oceanicola sp. D3]|uniref:hypothetical protein n=1 Tax=Oceanicola sp. D3 TaxID=2587163 RepID=UPI0011205204|nr:hypothetical protein [Oceanicola sp. D3]QDC07794.1 hypothetical protein FHY55_00390 [Oceanicola sp. D3]
MTPAAFLNAAARLEDFSQAEVEAALGLRLTATRKSQAWVGFNAPGSGPFSGFELRSPGPSARFGGLLIAHFGQPEPMTRMKPLLDQLRFLRIEPNPPGAGGPPTAGHWFQLGPHELAATVLLGAPERVAALAVHGAYP